MEQSTATDVLNGKEVGLAKKRLSQMALRERDEIATSFDEGDKKRYALLAASNDLSERKKAQEMMSDLKIQRDAFWVRSVAGKWLNDEKTFAGAELVTYGWASGVFDYQKMLESYRSLTKDELQVLQDSALVKISMQSKFPAGTALMDGIAFVGRGGLIKS